MRIVVIGQTAYGRSDTVQKLRRDGHDVVAAAPRRRSRAIAGPPRDPGHAGKPLRDFLEGIASMLRDLWLGRRQWFGRPMKEVGGHDVPGRHKGRRDDGGR